MTIRILLGAIVLASLSLIATDTEAKRVRGKPSTSTSSADKPSAKPTAKTDDVGSKAIDVKKAKDEQDAAPAPGRSINLSPRLSTSSQPSQPAPATAGAAAGAAAAGSAAAAASVPAGDAAQRAADETKRKELAALQRKADEEQAARRAEERRQQAEAAEAERKGQEEQEAQRRAVLAREKDARRNQLTQAAPACVIKPTMADEDLAKCRSR